ncbi:hypothetical protein [Candidatus Mycolicibacterium alkanivorans]|uniref:Uncharacterized protein n=1 Tax=Candidatus Mycolicibacterium alkanivorans TaxID=2954114 RepID=A0ABS9YR88_9MYCO|nr:hypothetical protein [Candidatus Mycolicibacterium alkanivorans]MCI4673750.1 hypothetical protein [Candidatus Mycolicibacterium alkanivorans]
MARYEPAGATGYSAGEAEDVNDANDTAPPIPFPDPFGPYPDRPYPGIASTAQPPLTRAPNESGAAPADATDPPTDPAMAPVRFDDGFDPFAADAFWFPERPWYRKHSATVAFAAISVALVAMLVAAVLLVSRNSGESGGSTGTSSSTTAPSTTPPTSSPPPQPPPSPPPPPAPPPESPPASAQPRGTWAPQYPHYPRQNGGDRPNVTTPQTRPPQISVRPSHRPAFPNQPGGG